MKEKILVFCLKHWKEIGLALLLLVVFAKGRYDIHNIIKANEISRQSLENQITELQSIHEQEIQQRDEALERFRIRNEQLEMRYQDALIDLANEIDKRKKNVIKRYREDKESLRIQIENTYGFTYVP
jgi:uncharacterized membrane protein